MPEVTSLTDQQVKIVDHEPFVDAVGKPESVLVTAAAGTGKTTVLGEVARKFVSRRQRVLYLVFNEKAKSDAESHSNMPSEVDCQTMHACAKQNCESVQSCVVAKDDHVHEKFILDVLTHEPMLRLQWPNSTPESEVHKELKLLRFWVRKSLGLFLASRHKECRINEGSWDERARLDYDELLYYPMTLDVSKSKDDKTKKLKRLGRSKVTMLG